MSLPLEPDQPIAYRARWVLPMDGPPIEDGVVTVAGGRIVEVGHSTAASQVVELGEGTLLPAFINAHTHLELSSFESPLGTSRQLFPEWIKEIVGWRRQQILEVPLGALHLQRAAAIERGLEEAARTGVVAVADIASNGWPAAAYATGGGVICEELLGLGEEQVELLYQRAVAHLDRVQQEFPDGRWLPGLSPHAPYTVHPELVRRVSELAAQRKALVAMHLAESFEEIELLASHSGPFVTMLESIGAWRADSIPRGIRPLDYLELLALAPKSLVVHGNFLVPEELDFLAAPRETMSLVYCPRTHHYFHAGEHPLRAALAAGVRVAVGTDSLASNPDLSVWEELRFVRQRYPELSDDAVLRMGTVDAAAALGKESEFGSITVGKRAALVVAEGDAKTPLWQRIVHPV